MDETEKKLRRWFRRHGWHTSDTMSYGGVYLMREDSGPYTKEIHHIDIEIDPVIWGKQICITNQINYTYLSFEELEKLGQLAKHNYDDLMTIRKRSRK